MKFNLKNVRVCFLKIWEKDTPRQADQKPAYRACILIDKEDPQADALEEACRSVLADKFKSEKNADKWMKRHYAQDSKECAVRDGDEREEVTEEFEGMLYLNTKSYKQPKIMTSKGEKQTEPGVDIEGDDIEGEEIYSGCYCNVSVDLWAWDNTNGKGLGAAILGLRFRDDGEGFGGGGGETASDGDLDDDDDAPKKSKSKSKRHDDEDDEPKKKKRRSRDEDDEDDEDEEDEAPRSRRRRR